MASERRKVLITGASGGLGSSIARRYGREGWDIICHYRSSEKNLVGLRDEIQAFGVDCRLLRADLSSPGELDGFVEQAANLQVDALVNNAGAYAIHKHFSQVTLDELNYVFAVNIFAPFLLAGALFKDMKDRGFGRIISLSSIAAKYGGSDCSVHYGCSKRALEGLTKSLAREGAEYNVLVNTVRPGVIDTAAHQQLNRDMEKRVAMIPMKKMGDARDVADLVYYLGSENNKFITAETIAIAGGE